MKKFFNYAIALLSMFALAQAASAITFSVTVPSPTYQCWVVGNFNGWDNAKNQMTKVDATHYTLTIPEADFKDQTVTSANIKYKYLSGPGDWAYVEKDSVGGEITDRNYSAADVVKKWALVFNPTVAALPKFVTINALVPVAVKQLYIVGTFNNWTLPTDSTMMTQIDSTADGKVFTKKLWTADANKLQYKFCAGPAWDYQQTSTVNIVFPAAEFASADVVTAFNKIYDPSKLGTVVIHAVVPAGTDTCWIQGSLFGWNMANAQKGVKNNDGSYTFTVKDVQSMEYRLYNRPDWDHPEADSIGAERKNRIVEYPAGAVTNITVIGWKNLANGIPQIALDKSTVFASKGTIVVNGAKALVELFNVSGQRIASVKTSGTYTSKKLTSGLYIVRVDGVTKKVLVK